MNDTRIIHARYMHNTFGQIHGLFWAENVMIPVASVFETLKKMSTCVAVLHGVVEKRTIAAGLPLRSQPGGRLSENERGGGRPCLRPCLPYIYFYYCTTPLTTDR